MSNKYRVVRDRYLGYEAQFRPWWSPIWLQCYGVNTSRTLDRAEALCREHATPVVEYLGKIPNAKELKQ